MLKYSGDGPSANINRLIGYLALSDAVVSLIRIILESAASLLGPVIPDSVYRKQKQGGGGVKYLPATDWNDLFNV